MVEVSQRTSKFDSEDDAISMILEGTAKVTGEAFFAALVENLSKAMDTHSAWVSEYIEESRTLKIFQIFAARASAELQRIRAEQDIRKREEKYRRIVETAREGFVLLDRNYKITDVNEMYCKMTGFRREEIIGKTPLDFSPENHRDFLMTHRKDLFSGKFENFESTVASRDGWLIPVLVLSNILRDDNSEIIGKMAFVTDMTEHKK